MLRVRKSTLRWLGIITLVMLVAAAVMARVATAAGGVNITTPPLRTGQATYFDVDRDGINDPEELIGTFTVYDGNKTIDFNWAAYAFSSGVNGSYRVSLVQNITPLGTATWKEIVIGHHWASNYNGASYTMGPFPAGTCTYCPGHFLVQPETYVQLYDPTTQTYEYEYTAIPAALGGAAVSLEQSDDFVLEIFIVAPPEGGGSDGDSCLNCNQACDFLVNDCRNAICQGEPCEECDSFGEVCPALCFLGAFEGEFEEEFGVCVDSGGSCQDAWSAFCEEVTDNEIDLELCLDDFEEAEEQGFCGCAVEPECSENYQFKSYNQ
jgi:hypothetical protein